jgi:hypothetical protein
MGRSRKGSLQNNMPSDYEMAAVMKTKEERINYSETAYVDSLCENLLKHNLRVLH